MLFRPGKLTVDFLDGRRARFVPPIRLYVFISLVFFFLLGQEVNRQDARPERQPERPERRAEHRADSTTRVLQPKNLGEAVGIVRDSLKKFEAEEREVVIKLGDTDSLSGLGPADLENKPLMERLASADDAYIDSLIRARGGKPDFWQRLALRQTARVNTRQEALRDKLIKNVSLGMFVLMPLFALLLKLFYRRQRPLYVQHLMFSINLHSFFFLFFSFLILLELVLPASREVAPAIPMLILWAYWVLALSRFSGQTIKKSLWKGSLLFAGYTGILVLFSVGVVLLSLIFF